MRDMLRSATAVILGLVGAAPLRSQTLPTRDSVQRIVRERVEAGGSAGLAVGVIDSSGDPYTIFASRTGVIPDANTVFEIGSITKAFTGVLLADMVLRGEVRLDQPVAELLPAGTRVPARGGRVITLEHLATHTSGLPRLPGNLRPADPTNPYADYSVAQLYEFLDAHDLSRDPGTVSEYSNLGGGLLGHALALRAGKSYEALIRERVLEPLAMRSTAITLSAEMGRRMAKGHDADGTVVPRWDLPTLAGAGALRSSLGDMMRFLAAVRTPPDNAVGRAIALSTTPRFRVNSALSVGFGWHISSFQGDTVVWHNGGTGGFRTMMGVNPGRGAGMVLLGNSSQDNDDIVRHALMNTPLAKIVARKEITLAPDVLASYPGTYEFAPQFSIVVTLENGALMAQPTGQGKFRIYAEAPDKFFLRVVEAQLEFTRDSSGAVTAVTLVQNGRQTGRKVK